MLELTNLEPDIVTYGVMAMGCINRQQAQEFFDKLAEKGVRFISIFVSCSEQVVLLALSYIQFVEFYEKITLNIFY